MKRRFICMSTVAGLAILVSSGPVFTQGQQHGSHGGAPNGSLAESVRDAIERFRDVRQALAAGYAQFQGCVSGPQQGAMGVHFAKGELFDGTIDVMNPEVLVYEPRNGRLHLVGAEYIVPAEAWEPTHDDYDKPHLMGQLYHYAPSPNRYGGGPFYELHVWAIKPNPNGTFADWNPNVSCAEWKG